MFRIDLSDPFDVLILVDVAQVKVLQVTQAVLDKLILSLDKLCSVVLSLLKFNIGRLIGQTCYLECFKSSVIVLSVRMLKTGIVKADHWRLRIRLSEEVLQGESCACVRRADEGRVTC